jgi:hypothetical protein
VLSTEVHPSNPMAFPSLLPLNLANRSGLSVIKAQGRLCSQPLLWIWVECAGLASFPPCLPSPLCCTCPGQPPSEAPKYQALTQFFDARRVCPAPTPLVCPNDCSGSGDCVADPITGAGVCSCYYGFSGTTCSSVDSLDFFDCG